MSPSAGGSSAAQTAAPTVAHTAANNSWDEMSDSDTSAFAFNALEDGTLGDYEQPDAVASSSSSAHRTLRRHDSMAFSTNSSSFSEDLGGGISGTEGSSDDSVSLEGNSSRTRLPRWITQAPADNYGHC
eukprot:6722-Heterococcus_DN1.PRE.1